MLTLPPIIRRAASPALVFYTLPWLMVLLVIGTISQKYIGLYGAIEIYFHSWFFWVGIMPLPGGLPTIGLIFLGLLIKFIFFSHWNWQKSGTILTHLGVLILLLGGIITATTSKEYFMIIPERQKQSALSDYFEREIFLTPDQGPVLTLPFDKISQGQVIKLADLGLNSSAHIKILMKCDNCSARAPSEKYENLQGLAQNMELFPIPNELQPEANFSGIIFELKGAQNQDGTYIVMEDFTKNPVFNLQGKKPAQIEISLGRKKTELPYAIELQDFRKIDYPGTNKAKKYESDIVIHDQTIAWPVTIHMNNPLRYKGYSFYQSSFVQHPDQEMTVLNVVRNQGRIFPYVASFVIFCGLMLHLVLRIQKREVKK
ncbi:MAG: cytochrome c biogenesis protein ResB [Alphaproteobacteria bacterium]|nr:cytochrome c biogenesis protein ResB [Alphaproteobacteria bacterium]